MYFRKTLKYCCKCKNDMAHRITLIGSWLCLISFKGELWTQQQYKQYSNPGLILYNPSHKTKQIKAVNWFVKISTQRSTNTHCVYWLYPLWYLKALIRECWLICGQIINNEYNEEVETGTVSWQTPNVYYYVICKLADLFMELF